MSLGTEGPKAGTDPKNDKNVYIYAKFVYKPAAKYIVYIIYMYLTALLLTLTVE